MLGDVITAEEIMKLISANTETVYGKPEENKAYWVKGDETENVNIW